MNELPKKIVLFLIVIIGTCIIILVSNFSRGETSYVQVDSNNMIASYAANYCYVDIYQQKDKIVINAYSDGKFDKPNQIVIPFEEKITEEDISIKWKTLGDKVVDQDSDSIIVANVMIEKDCNVICNENINLFEEGWKVLDDVVGQ